MSRSTTSLIFARAALDRLRPTLPATTIATLEQRLGTWEQQVSRQQRPAVARPELVMRPGLPPRPLNKHYFTVVRSL